MTNFTQRQFRGRSEVFGEGLPRVACSRAARSPGHPLPRRRGGLPRAWRGAQVDWHLSQGTAGLARSGTNRRVAHALTRMEHERVIAAVVRPRARQGKRKCCPGTGSNSTTVGGSPHEIRRQGRGPTGRCCGFTLLQPADARKGSTPHYAKVAESVDLPIVVYNVPSRTGRNVDPETIERLAKVGLDCRGQGSEPAPSTRSATCSSEPNLGTSFFRRTTASRIRCWPSAVEALVSVVGIPRPKDVIALIGLHFRTGNACRVAAAACPAFSPSAGTCSGCAPNPIPGETAPGRDFSAGATARCASPASPRPPRLM